MIHFDQALQLAHEHLQAGRLADAEQIDRQLVTLDPRSAEAQTHLGVVLQAQARFAEAAECFERALNLRPDSPELFYNLANALAATNANERAADAYRRAIGLAPHFALAHNNLGALLQRSGDLAAAERSFGEAVRCDPNFAAALFNLGVALEARGELAAAEDCYRRSVAADPRQPSAHFNLGALLQQRRQWEAAETCYRAELALRPQHVGALCNLGTLCMARGQDAEALEWFDRALAVDPASGEAHSNRGMLLLAQGDFAAGWSEFNWFGKCAKLAGKRYPGVAWDGAPLEGRTLLVHCSHGLGDTFQFVRYLAGLRERGAGKVILAVQGALAPILSGQVDVDLLIDRDAPPPPFDVQASIMSLPALFNTTAATIPAEIPYLSADDVLVERWRERLAPLTGLKVGIHWQGRESYPWDHLRSFRLAEFEPLAAVSGVELISLQHGAGREQLSGVAGRFRVTDLGDDVDRQSGAFMDTAALMKNLDLVITSDSAVAHLAGALGVNTWVVLSYAPEWRWQRQGETSPWYPTMRLVRQTKWNDWPETFARMADALSKLVVTRCPDRTSGLGST